MAPVLSAPRKGGDISLLRFEKYPFFKAICFKLYPHFLGQIRGDLALKKNFLYKNEKVYVFTGWRCMTPIMRFVVTKILEEINIGGI